MKRLRANIFDACLHLRGALSYEDVLEKILYVEHLRRRVTRRALVT